MNRRKFIKLSASAAIPLYLSSCHKKTAPPKYDIEIHSDIKAGHLVFESESFKLSETLTTETLIVGGGISGLSAANQLQSKDFLLCELSDRLGGSSASHEFNNTTFTQGAHYELAYPQNYGENGLSFLEKLNIIHWNPSSQLWEFNDKQYLINESNESRCMIDGEFRKDALPAIPLTKKFYQHLKQYSGKMPMPSSQIHPTFHKLNNITFTDYLKNFLSLTHEFIQGLDYHMMDDYGAKANQVSALAGIHYYKCRPYDEQPIPLFSPPEGNAYFTKKFSNALPVEAILTQHLVKRIKAIKGGFETEIIDVENRSIKKVTSKKVIYAGQKHALKYIYPEDRDLFANNIYAPWITMNFVIDPNFNPSGFWQNEMITDQKSFLGFVDSNAQYSTPDTSRILTLYYCFPPKDRNLLANIETTSSKIITQAINHLESYFNRDLKPLIQKVFINAMGHAMPIPIPNYLLNDKNKTRSNPNLVYAGVDNSRLPLLFEAIDSGIVAANLINL